MSNAQVVPDMIDDLKKQAEYVKSQKAKKNAGAGLVFAEAFLRGMRDLGYKGPDTAVDELVDNAIQANATIVDIALAYDGKSQKKPDQIAVIDNGHGMLPEMIYFAVKWGGTHRENDRSGFGRYGYGLPSAAVSIAKRYTVYSKIAGEEWHAVTVDIEELASMAEKGEQVDIPAPVEKELPKFVMARKSPIDVQKLKSGTVVVLEELDRMNELPSWKTSSSISAKLLRHLGVIYRHIIPNTRIFVNDEEVQVVDPLFLMEAGRFYDENKIMAQPVETKSFETETPLGRRGLVKIRASWLPANFQAVDPNMHPQQAKTNKRFEIMDDFNGLLMCRAGRQIDCATINPWTKFTNYDKNIKIELDFDPAIDEFFGITTSKQQIVIREDMFSRLEAAGVSKLIIDLRKKFRQSLDELEAKLQQSTATEQPRPSEEAMRNSEKFKTKPANLSPEQIEKANEKLKDEAEKESERTGKPIEQVVEEITKQTKAYPYKVEFQVIPEGPFYRPERIGAQKKLIINTQHRFYTHLYNAPDSKPEIQSALEVLLFVLADGELDSKGDFETFYLAARKDWSEGLSNSLKQLDLNDSLRDKSSAKQEEREAAAVKNSQ